MADTEDLKPEEIARPIARGRTPFEAEAEHVVQDMEDELIRKIESLAEKHGINPEILEGKAVVLGVIKRFCGPLDEYYEYDWDRDA